MTLPALGRDLEVGARVRGSGAAGTLKPHATGHPVQVTISGQIATLRCFVEAVLGGASESRSDLAVVRWDPAEWTEADSGEVVTLESFEDSIHPDYLLPLD